MTQEKKVPTDKQIESIVERARKLSIEAKKVGMSASSMVHGATPEYMAKVPKYNNVQKINEQSGRFYVTQDLVDKDEDVEFGSLFSTSLSHKE